jgi:hypothetical protein
LKKHVTNKHIEEYRRWGLFVVKKSKNGGDQRQAAKMKDNPSFSNHKLF